MKSSKSSPLKQGEAFKSAARNLGCDEDTDVFDRALKKVASAPPPKSVKKRKPKKLKRSAIKS